MDRNQLLNDDETAQRYALDGRQAMIWTAMPAIVQSVNLVKMTITAQLAIKGTQTNEDGSQAYVKYPPLLDVPICFPSAGGFILTMPITVGDEVLIVFGSRCIDGWWQLGGVQVPLETRMHDLSDAFAIPGPRSVPNAPSGISGNTAQLRSNDGLTYLEITKTGKINLVAPSGVNITGNLSVSGEVIAQTATVPIPLSTHVHPGVTSGGSDTGAPIP